MQQRARQQILEDPKLSKKPEVIDAFNRDLPYDQFVREQIAGDLLPNATVEQKVATGFHRNTMINEEGDNISAGQKQLLTIARAFLADPRGGFYMSIEGGR